MKYLCVLLMILFSFCVKAQNRNIIWMLGYQPVYKDCGLSFSSATVDTFSVWKNLEFFITDASICDTLGNLLFYTNGTYIANKNHDTLYNSKDFNSGYLTDVYYEGTGLGIAQGTLVLPIPDIDSSYYVFYESAEKIYPSSGYDVEPLDLRYSVIKMTLDNGLGGIEIQSKKVPIVIDTLCAGRITACKHANGRDWWLIVRKYLSNKYYKLLVTPDTITVSEQSIGFTFSKNDALGMAVFSPQGDLYAHLNNDDTLQIMKFNRCTGEFSDPVMIEDMDTVWTHGCAFSPSGRFLYVASYLHVFQFDMLAADIASSKQVAAAYADTVVGFPRWFGLMQLAPDNKIYVSTYGGNTFLHVIDSPDSLGLACNVIQSGVVLPSYNSLSLPNFPNYDLGPLIGSACDTLFLSTQTQPSQPTFTFTPNPSSDNINVVYAFDKNATLTITNAVGSIVKQLTIYSYFKNRIIYTNELPAGVYLVTITNGENRISKKLVVAR